MFTGTRTGPHTTRRTPKASKDSKDRGVATLRIYNSADYPFGWIYEEAVLGAYRPSRAGDPVVITSGGPDHPRQEFSLSPKTSYARHLGEFPRSVRERFDETEPGAPFFLRDRKMLRLTDDEVKAVVFSLPVWVAARADAPLPTAAAPAIPIGAKMCRRSLFSEAAGKVAAVLREEGADLSPEQPSLFDDDAADGARAART
jgi:hypothetical protein